MNLPVMAGSLSSLAAEYGAPLANHLWQSTGFAGMVWLLTFQLRKNRAQTRYCLWLAASAKFLLPFSLLVGLGSHLQWSRTPAVTQPKLFVAMEAIGHPFSLPNPPPVPITAPPGMLEAVLRNLPVFLLMVWFAGGVAVLLMWFLRWRRLTAARRATLPSKSGREFEALRRMELRMRSPRQISLVLSQSTLGPGILGVFRPLLVLPAGISERLTDAQLESVITHELCHVRRRDNLAAALHMLVEALFWFHPLVWWIGARLVAERERACDEEVLRQGSEPQAYAEGILKVCEFYLESPLVCVAGVTGSNLKQRIEEIMVHRIARKLNLAKKLVLTTSAAAALALPVIVGLLHPVAGRAQSSRTAASSVLQDVSIRPAGAVTPGESVRMRFLQQNGTLDVKNITLQHLIHYAYGVSPARIAGAPGWMASDLYDLNLKTKEDIGGDPFKLALQELISQRFKLAAHHEWKSGP